MKTKPQIISNKVAVFFDRMLKEKKERQNEIRRKLENGELKIAK